MCFRRKNAGEATFNKSVTFLSIALLKYERTSKVLELVNPNETQPRLNVVKYTCAFPAATRQKVRCEKGRLSSRVKWTELSLLGDVDQIVALTSTGHWGDLGPMKSENTDTKVYLQQKKHTDSIIETHECIVIY